MSNPYQSTFASSINDQSSQSLVRPTNNTLCESLNVISLFSGGGGLDLGLEAAGFQTHFENDIDPYSCATLEMGRIAAMKRGLSIFSNSVVLAADVKMLEGNFVLESSRLKKGEISLLAGGPPCQAFSVFGNRKGREDHRGQLVYEYFRLLSEIAPEAFLFENVYGLMTVENGDVFKMACEQLKEPRKGLRYQLSILRLNAANYGVPQFRDRIFIIGSREGKKIKEIDELTVDPRNFIGSSQLKTPYEDCRSLTKGSPPTILADPTVIESLNAMDQ
jgi:DNA (cytosine-5)-methyltransferase 1